MFHFQLVTLTGVKVDADVAEVLLPTLDGQIGVLAGHMPLTSVLSNGVISIRKNPRDSDIQMDHFAAYGGVIDISNNLLRVLADQADSANEINEVEANKAFELAKKMKSEAKDQLSLENAQKLLDRSAVRIQIAGIRRRSKK